MNHSSSKCLSNMGVADIMTMRVLFAYFAIISIAIADCLCFIEFLRSL